MEEKWSNPVNYTEHPLYIAVKLHLADTHKHAGSEKALEVL